MKFKMIDVRIKIPRAFEISRNLMVRRLLAPWRKLISVKTLHKKWWHYSFKNICATRPRWVNCWQYFVRALWIRLTFMQYPNMSFCPSWHFDTIRGIHCHIMNIFLVNVIQKSFLSKLFSNIIHSYERYYWVLSSMSVAIGNMKRI